MDSNMTDGTGALAPSPPTEVQQRRRLFTLVPFDQRHRANALLYKQDASPVDIVELAEFLDVVDATEEIDWQLRKWLHVQDELRNAKERLAAAKTVCEYYETQAEQLSEFITGECREKYEDLVAREHKGKSKYTDHALSVCNRLDLVVRVGLRSLPPLINVFDDELLISSVTEFIEAPGKLKKGAPAWLKWNAPVEGHWAIGKAELNKEVKAGEDLPGVEIITKQDKLYFEDKSRKEK